MKEPDSSKLVKLLVSTINELMGPNVASGMFSDLRSPFLPMLVHPPSFISVALISIVV